MLQCGVSGGERVAVLDFADIEFRETLLGDGFGDEVAVVEQEPQLRTGEDRGCRTAALGEHIGAGTAVVRVAGQRRRERQRRVRHRGQDLGGHGEVEDALEDGLAHADGVDILGAEDVARHERDGRLGVHTRQGQRPGDHGAEDFFEAVVCEDGGHDQPCTLDIICLFWT